MRLQPSAAHAFHRFFPLAALYAALAVMAWLGGLSGTLPLPAQPTLWHGHEMLYGFAVAVIAGFVLTAVANWTGLQPAGPALLALLCGLWLAGRLAAWQSPRLWSEPMLWILHLGYAWLALAFALAAAVHAGGLAVPMTAPMHALMSGALGCLALGMMTRVALGHSGRPIVASPAMVVAFVLVTAAGLARLGSYVDWIGGGLAGLAISAVVWSLAFSIYALEFMTRLWLPATAAHEGDDHASPSAS